MRKMLLYLLLFSSFALQSVAQKGQISGKVTDEKGIPISGASVVDKKTKKGISTGVDGNFVISMSAGETLVISYVGFEKKEFVLTDSKELTIALKPLSQSLSEVVVTASGIKREKKALGYAVSTIDKKDLELRPEADLGRVLNGKAPGLNINNTSGLSGSGTNINIRGISTITGNSSPLFIVDGVPFDGSTNTANQGAGADFLYGHQTSSRFLDLDPNNIESVNILKGLSAVTLYGEEGRNGVILITTKNGSTQKTRKKIEISVSQSYFETKAILPEYNTKYGGGFDLSVGIAFFSNWGGAFTNPPQEVTHPYDRPSGIYATDFPQFHNVPYAYKYYNSVPRFFRTGTTSTTSVNAAGSAGVVNYNMNYSYTDDQGYVTGNGLNKNSFGIGGTAKLSNNFTVSGTINYVSTDQTSPPTSNSTGNSGTYSSVFGDVLYTPTAVDLIGLPWEFPSNHGSVYYRANNGIQNPIWTLHNSFTQDKVNRVFGQMQARYEFFKGLSLTYKVGYDNYSEFQLYGQNQGGQGSHNPNDNLGYLRTNTGVSTIWDHSLLLNYSHNLSNDFNLSFDAGANSRTDIYSQTGQMSRQQLVFGLMNHSNFVSHDVYSESGVPLNFDSKTLGVGVFGFGTLGFRDYAYLTLGGRNSWKSTVEQPNRSIFYPNATVSFIPTSAIEALKNNKTINYLKFRVGYSTSANFPSPYATRPYLNIATKIFVTSDGSNINTNSIPSQVPNPNLKPELLKEAEAGVEGKFFNNRISIDLTAYQRIASDQILLKTIDPASGSSTELINAGKVTNKGIELQLGLTVIQTKDWKWELTGLYTLNKSLVSDIPADLPFINISGYSNQGNIAENGYALGVIYGTYFEKDPKSGKRLVGSDGNYIVANTPGVIGDPNALYKVTGISTLSYKEFSFRMQWDYTQGGDMLAGTAAALLGRGVTKDTEFDRAKPLIMPGVLQDGQPNNIQISSTQDYYNNSIVGAGASESAIYDATVIRLREASLSYSVPVKALSKLPFGSVSISVTGSNLWYYAPNMPKYIHFDPDANGLGVGNGRGIEFLSGPSARRMGASLRITF
jgi:TonB-linked SusC/RagA family outer membrane protein